MSLTQKSAMHSMDHTFSCSDAREERMGGGAVERKDGEVGAKTGPLSEHFFYSTTLPSVGRPVNCQMRQSARWTLSALALLKKHLCL